jgi:P4 family phage/plasmid primase-like protien
MRKFRISTGKSRLSPTITRKTVSWKKLAKRLLTYEVVDLTFDEYSALDRETQSTHKDVGYFIGGWFNKDKRTLDQLATRCCIALDIDHLDSWDLKQIEITYGYWEYVVHSTLKHSDNTPRLRLVFPLAKDITPDKYEPLARILAARIGMDIFDDTTFQPARIMFWPAVTRDGEIFKKHNEGVFIDAEKWLTLYDDWTDFSEWPHSSRVKAIRPSTKKAEDPLTKKGIIGAFNRTYDIHAAIERFDLPYEQTDHDNRYRPVDATGPSGAVVYDDVFLYSHHESDAVGMRNVNAWDLVRIHRFGDADAAKNLNDIPIMEHPSSKQMAAMALAIPEVERELRTPRHEMDVLPATGSDVDVGEERRLDASQGHVQDLTFDSLRDEINDINTDALNLHAVLKSEVKRVAAAKLDPEDVSVLAGTLREKYPKPQPSKASIEKSIIVAGKHLTGAIATNGQLRDMERLLIQAVLDDNFAGGDTIKRIGKRTWTYSEGYWKIWDDEAIRGKLGNTFTRLREERPDDMMSLVATVGEGKTSQLVRQVWGMMCDDLAGHESREDPLQLLRSFPLPVINCKNCELHFDAAGTMTVQDHDPNHFYTIRVATHFDETAQCPEWDRFTRMVFSNTCDPDDMTRHLEEFGGYVLQMSRWLKTWAMFHGPTNTGKSTVATILQTMLGDAFTGKSMDKFAKSSSDFSEAGIIGKLLMVDDDYAYGAELPDGFLKKYSEEKQTTTSMKYGDDLNFRARAMPLILSNHWPGTRDTTAAFLGRAFIMPFTFQIVGKDQDDQRQKAMFNELPGILNRFLAGLSRLRARGAWDKPIDCIEVEQAWTRKSNPFLEFVTECLTRKRGARIERSEAYETYEHWHFHQHGSSHRDQRGKMVRRTFYERMREHFGNDVKSNQWFFLDVQKSDNAPTLSDELDTLNDGEVRADTDDWDC